MIYEKPKNEIFASDAKDGEIVEFPNVKRGWGVTENLGFIPPMEYFNAAFNRVDKSLAYQLQRGVGEWDKDMEYPIGAVVSLNGVIYIAKSQNTNKNPANEATIWGVFATQKWCEDTFMKKTDKIDAYTKKQSDDNFVSKTDIATETKVGITKLKNAITAKQDDVAVTEKAVAEVIEANKGLGIGQTLQDVTADKRAGETYENTAKRTIISSVITLRQTSSCTIKYTQDGIEDNHDNEAYVRYVRYNFILPPGSTYRVDVAGAKIIKWLELR